MESEVTMRGSTDPCCWVLWLGQKTVGEELSALETPLLGPQVTGVFTGSTFFTPPVTVAHQSGACTPESLHPGVSSLVKCVYFTCLSGGKQRAHGAQLLSELIW